jgi:hypothetical protein
MTVYANLVNGQILGVYDLLPKVWNGHTNFDKQCAEDTNFMQQNNFRKIIKDNTAFDSATHRMSDFPTYSVIDNKVYEHREILEIPKPNPPTREELLVTIRKQRDQLMSEFEWRYVRYTRQQRLGLTPTDNIVEMDQYMQKLADITNQDDLNNLVWPEY